MHDVWNEQSGAARSYVHIANQPSIDNLMRGLKQGHSYASQGPLIVPEIIFGSEISHPATQTLNLNYQLFAVAGLKSVSVIERGKDIARQTFSNAPTSSNVSFTVKPLGNSWYSLVVEDSNGKFAYSNPLWVDVQ